MSAAESACSTAPVPGRTPEPFLRAEIAAFPLASEEAFLSGLVQLDPSFKDARTAALWRACEKRLAPHTGWSLDRLVAERDRGWFGDRPRCGNGTVTLHDYLHTLACSYLLPRAGVTEVREETEITALDAADHYRWLTFALPEDLLLSALGVDPAPIRVDLDPPLLVRRLLDLGVAEIHQHLGAAMDFSLLWTSALAAVIAEDVTEDALASPGSQLDEGERLIGWILTAATARAIMAEFLIRAEGTLESFVERSCFKKEGGWTPRRLETLADALRALMSPKEGNLPPFEALRDLYAVLHPTALTLGRDPLQGIDDAYQRCDPIAARLGLRGKNAGERWFMREGFVYLAGNGRADPYFSKLFWQIIRVRCLYFRTVVQRPLTGGLQWFVRFHGHVACLRGPLNPILPEVSYAVAGQQDRIRALELRTSLWSSAIETGVGVLEFLRSWQRVLNAKAGPMFEPEMGLVFLFVKNRDEVEQSGWRMGRPAAFWSNTAAEPQKKIGQEDLLPGRYVNYFVEQYRQATALAELIQAVPSSLWVIRGLDVANDELAIPTWVLAPLFRHLQNLSAKVSILEHDDAGPPLSITAHAGEDFLHLLQGMRRIYEQIHYVLGGAKGRLGHAVALGVDPQAWAQSVGSVLMPAEERLWDLVLEWRLYTRYKIRSECAATAPPGRVEIVANMIRDLADLVYGRYGCRVEELAQAHHMLHLFLVPEYVHSLDHLGRYHSFVEAVQTIRWSDEGAVRSQTRVKRILEAYLQDEGTFRRGQTLIDVPVRPDEIEALNAVQHALRRGVAQRGIVVEVNPSSNLLIGDLRDLRNHPILRLHPPVPVEGSPPSVPIALGSDDPITFNSQLLKEYVLLHQAACAAGYPEPVVQEWLELVRRTGMDARFTRAWCPSCKEKVKKLIDDFQRYLHEPPSMPHPRV